MTNLDIWLKKKGIEPNIPKKFYVEAFREDCQYMGCSKCIVHKVCVALDTCLCVDKNEFANYANYELKEK